jgi:hypothetical protein
MTAYRMGASRPELHRSVGALLVAVLLAIGIFSASAVTQAPAAHAAGLTAAAAGDNSAFTGAGLKNAPTRAELKAAARRATKGGKSVARASGALPVSIRFNWWGAVVSLEREAACFAATGYPALGNLIMSFIPPPWNFVTMAAVNLHKYWIGAQMGSQGVDLHFNWGGFIHWVEPRGPRQAC